MAYTEQSASIENRHTFAALPVEINDNYDEDS